MRKWVQVSSICLIGFLILSGILFGYWKFKILPASTMVPILCYHKISYDSDPMSVSPERFQTQLQELRKMGYYTIHLNEWYEYWKNGKKVALGALIITFDDGYQNNYSKAAPILKATGNKATLFLIVKRQIQWDFLDWDEVRALREDGWEIGSHSWSHVDLTQRPDFHGEVEIKRSRMEIEKRSLGDVRWFAYPFGFWSDETIEWVKSSGYDGAVTTRWGLADLTTERYVLERIPVIPSVMPAALDIRLRLLRAEFVEFYRWIRF